MPACLNRFAALLLAGALCSGLVQADFNLPSLGDASSGVSAPQQEYLLGRAWLSALRGQVRTIEDPEIKDYVEHLIYRLVETSEIRDRRLEIVVVDSPALNAFAVPGGIIGINAGLFLYTDDEQQFASVIAHELAHVSQRHYARNLEAAQRNRPLDMAATLASVVLLAAGAGDAGMAALAGSQAAMIERNLAYSRQFEQEADRVGMGNLYRAGMDPRAMPEMFEAMHRANRFAGNRPPEFLLTHPVTESRISDTRARAEQYPQTGRKNPDEFLLMREKVRLHYARSPQIALSDAKAEAQAEPNQLSAQYRLALAQSAANQADAAVRTLTPLLTRAPHQTALILAQVQADAKRGQSTAALSRLEQALTYSPADFALQYVQADLLMQAGRPEESARILAALSRQRPGDPDIWYLLAEVQGLSGNRLDLHLSRAEYFRLVGDLEQADAHLGFALEEAGDNFATRERIRSKRDELQQYRRLLEQL